MSERRRAIAFAAVGARPYHYRLLAALEHDGPMSQTELAWLTGIDPADIVAALDELTIRVSRAKDPADRRRNVVALTLAGRRHLDELEVVVRDVQASVLAPLTDDEQAELRRLLKKLLPPRPTPSGS